jgi:hypothetical protein
MPVKDSAILTGVVFVTLDRPAHLAEDPEILRSGDNGIGTANVAGRDRRS